jgi:hypothetical protein
MEHRNHGPTMPFGCGAQLVDLVLGCLIVGDGAASVDGDAFGHRGKMSHAKLPQKEFHNWFGESRRERRNHVTAPESQIQELQV